MKRKFLTALMALVATLCLCFGLAACGGKDDEPQEGGDEQDVDIEELEYEKREDEQGGAYFAVIGIGTVEEHEIVIPASREGLPVKEIGESAFEASADARCAALTSIEIPDSVTSIGKNAFLGCSGLESVSIHDLSAWCKIDFAMFSNPLIYAQHLYRNGSEITNLEIPAGITEIKDWAFAGCIGLTSVTIGEGVTSIGTHAFYNCSGLTGATIGSGVTSIGAHAFTYCSGLTSMEIPDGVTSIGEYAFLGCVGLTSITIPGSVNSIGSYAFSHCSGLTEITIPDSVTEIAEHAFEGCNGLTNMVIPGNVASIGDSAFAYCSGLERVTIGGSVTSIGQNAFYGCSGLTDIQFQGGTEEWQAIEKGVHWDYETGDYTVTCTGGTV